MRPLLTFLIVALLLIMIRNTAAADLVLDAGLGAFSSEGRSLSQVKFAKAGVETTIHKEWKQKFNLGGWLDSRGQGRTNSAFTGYQLGYEVQGGDLIGSIFTGPSVISSPDTALGGNLQFNETIFFGIKDNTGGAIGISYNHLSSAGLSMPNLGRDFLGLSIKF